MLRTTFVFSLVVLFLASCGSSDDGGGSCTALDNGDGTFTLACPDGTEVTLSNGEKGGPGDPGESCAAVDNEDGTYTVTCPDGAEVILSDGAAGRSCTVADNGDGTYSLTCDDGTDVTWGDGQDGEQCSVNDNGEESYSVDCPDGSSVILSDGVDGEQCYVEDNQDGSYTMTCPDGSEVTFQDGASAEPCTVVDNGDGTYTMSCPDGTEVTLSDGEQGVAGEQGPTGESPIKNVLEYGAVGDGVTDDTEAINAALADGGDVYAPMGTYVVSAPLLIAEPTRFRGAGPGLSKLVMVTEGLGETILVRSNYVFIEDLALEGPSPNETYTGGEWGIRFLPPEGSTRIYDVSVTGCEISNYGYDAISLDHVERGVVRDNYIHRIGYSGIACLSCVDVRVSSNVVDLITPGAPVDGYANAYGIKFSFGGSTPDAEDPPSTRCIVDGNIVSNVPTWECYDSHNGSYLTFVNNVGHNCRMGIMVGAVKETTPTVHHIVIKGNTLNAGSYSHTGGGIIVHGSELGYAHDVVIADNLVEGYGATGNTNLGAINMSFCGGISVANNYISEFAEGGVIAYHTNTLFTVTGNTFEGGTSTSGVYYFSASSHSNHGYVAGNFTNGYPSYVNPKDEFNNTVTIGTNH
jgi:hypothetical protein